MTQVRLMTDWMNDRQLDELAEYADTSRREVDEDTDQIMDYLLGLGEPYTSRDIMRLHRQFADCSEFYLLDEFLSSLRNQDELGGEAGGA